MTDLLILTGVAGLAALVVVMLAYNHRAELDRRRLVRTFYDQARDRFNKGAGHE